MCTLHPFACLQPMPGVELWAGLDHISVQLVKEPQVLLRAVVSKVDVSLITYEDLSGGVTLSVSNVSVTDPRPGAQFGGAVFGPNPAASSRRGGPAPAVSRASAEDMPDEYMDAGWANLHSSGDGILEVLARLRQDRGSGLDAGRRTQQLRHVEAIAAQAWLMPEVDTELTVDTVRCVVAQACVASGLLTHTC